MSLSDPARVAVYSRLTASTWTELGSLATPQAHGFDHLDVTWLADFRDVVKTELQIAAAFPLGTRRGATDFWLRSAVPQRKGGNVWQVLAHYEGRIDADKPMSVRTQATNEVFGIDSLTAFGFTDVPANVREASPSVELGYVLVDGTPPTHLVGLAGAPAVSPAVRAGFWGGLAAQRINYPSGWIFTSVDVDHIAGSVPPADYVRETWQYFQLYLPV